MAIVFKKERKVEALARLFSMVKLGNKRRENQGREEAHGKKTDCLDNNPSDSFT